MTGLMWLASYPKSGNTWTRAVLTQYFHGADYRLDISALEGEAIANERERFDEELGVASSDLADADILRLRRDFHRQLARGADAETFIKTHDAYRHGRREPLFHRESTRGAVYLVRNPLDVAVSYANHLQRDLDWIIHYLNEDDATLGKSEGGIYTALPQYAGSWRRNVVSWTEQSEIPVLLVRYEDCLADPVRAFGRIAEFMTGACDPDRLSNAVERTAFDALYAQERTEKRGANAPVYFFRAGRAGDGRALLSAAQIARILDHNGEAMERLGYSTGA